MKLKILKNYPRVPYGISVHDNKEINAVIKVLKNSTQMGRNTFDFEKKILKVLITFYLPFDDDDACLCV